MDQAIDVGKRLQSLRKTRGLTTRALADRVGVSVVTVWKWEHNSSKPRPRARQTLTSVFGTDIFDETLNAPTPGPAAANVETIRPAKYHAARDEALTSVIDRAKQLIAQASGTSVRNVTVRIVY